MSPSSRATSSAERPVVVAPATPAGRGALAVVRWTGPSALDRVRPLLRRLPGGFSPRRPILVDLVDDRGEPIDQGLLTFFPGPGSFTGEDVVEFSGHGNPRLVARILDAAVAAGAELASPGEFTLRAYLNGRIELDEAEAVRDLVDAQTDLAARLALGRLDGSGEARQELSSLRDRGLALLASVEAGLDFGETDGVEADSDWRGDLDEFGDEIRRRARRAQRLDRLERARSVVIVGPPNAGKSTLFNRLLDEDRAMVSPLPGTTRDSLRAVIDWHGIPVELVDTAGLAETRDPLEAMAIERSRRAVQEAAALLVVVGPESGDDRKRLTRGRELLGDRPGVVILSQWDDGRPGPGEPACRVSVHSGFGWDDFRAAFGRLVGEELVSEASSAEALGRHARRRLEGAVQEVDRAREAAESRGSAELVAEHLRQALRCLGEAVGDGLSEDLLGEVFSGFCIGK